MARPASPPQTPPQAYDDSFSIRHAKERGGYVVSNDLFRDHIAEQATRAEKEEARRWLKTHVISFCFCGDEFLPNPDFKFED
jgi:hypothetical protein